MKTKQIAHPSTGEHSVPVTAKARGWKRPVPYALPGGLTSQSRVSAISLQCRCGMTSNHELRKIGIPK